MCFKYEVWEMTWNMWYRLNWYIDVALACKVNEMDVIEMAMVLVWDETLYSWNWWMRWYGTTWNTNENLVTNIDPRFECMIIVTWLYEYIWYESVRNSLEFLGETSGSCFSGRDVIPWPLLVSVHGGAPSI